jgi:anti-sigma factor RsiW
VEVYDPFADQVELYVLGALSGDDRRNFEAHLAACDRCAFEVRSFAPVVAGLAGGVTAQPSPAVRAALMAKIRPAPNSQVSWMALAAAIVLAVGLGT